MQAAIFNVVPPLARLLLRDEPSETANQSWAGLFSQRCHEILLARVSRQIIVSHLDAL
jgi:hypothetical protein